MEQMRCPYCGRWFKPELRKGTRQTTCGCKKCRRAHKRELGRQWRAKNPERTLGRQGKVRAWAKQRNYWKTYLAEHPEQAQRNREQTRQRMKRMRAERGRGLALLADPVRYLRGIRVRCGDVCKTGTGQAPAPTENGLTAEDVCKTGLGGAIGSTENKPTADDVCKKETCVVGVVDYLLARELFAKQEGLDAGRAVAG